MSRFHSLRVVRAMVLGLCVVTSTPLAAAWAASAPPPDCHECCPDGLRSAPPENCCIAAPAGPSAPASVRITVVAVAVGVPLLPVAPWALTTLPITPARTAPPPLPPMAVLLRTSVLLI